MQENVPEKDVNLDEDETGGEGGRRIFEVSFISRKDARIVTASSSVEGSNER